MLSSLFDVPSYHMLSSLFDVSVSTVLDEINICLPILEEYFGSFVRWPTLNEWLELRGEWQKLPLAIGAIDMAHQVKYIALRQSHRSIISQGIATTTAYIHK
jgi:hypothetical protein